MGAMAGAEAMGKGIAAAGQSLAEGMEVGRQRKVARKGTETKIQALMKLHEGNEKMTSRLAPLLNTLQSDEARGSEKDAIVSQIDPLVNAITAKQAQDVATAEANFNRTMQAADVFLKGEALELERQKLKPTQITPFNELGVRTAPDGRIQYRSTAIEENDKTAQKNFQERLSATADTPDDIRQLKEFRDLVAESDEGLRLLQMAQGKLGDVAGSEYTRRFMQFQTGFAQKIAKARNGAIVTDDDVRQAKDSIFGLGKTKQENLDIIDATIREYEGKQLEISKADAYLREKGTLLGYVPSSNFNPAGGREEQQGGGAARQGGARESAGPGSALGQLIEQEEQEAKGTNRAPAPAPAPPMGQGPGDSPETPVPDVEVEGRVPGPPASRLQQSRVQRALEQQEASLEDAAQAVPVPAEPIPEEIDTSGAGVAEPTTKAVALTSSPASSAVALSDKIEGAALPKYSAKLVQNFAYDPSATEKIKPRFVPGLAERTKLRKAGNVLLNLDANHSGKKNGKVIRRVLEPIMVIPDDATPEARLAAGGAIALMDELFEKVHGRAPKASLESRLKTTSQNKSDTNQGGRKGVIHSELFAVTDNKMVNFLKTEAGIKEYTGILREAFRDVPKLQIFLPHNQKDQGAETDKGSSEVSLALRALKYL
tara:strand:- start:1476 stop:3443 length:1968 start_codon:yes stop_codon:yes gene_type:complete